MNNLPSDIILNIIMKKYETEKLQMLEDIKKLKKQLLTCKFDIDNLEHKNIRMLNYLENREVKYCEECECYGDDDEITFFEENDKYLCETCKEWLDEQSDDD